MGQHQKFLHLLWLVCLVATATIANHAAVAAEDVHISNLADTFLKAIPPASGNSSVSTLVLERNCITLSAGDRRSLAAYPQLVELHLDANQVTCIPARYFAVVPHLGVLSLSGNRIGSLEPESFYGLDALTMLNLSHNLLANLPAQLLSHLNNLQVVDLQGNPWNCSRQLLSAIEEIIAAGITVAGTNTKCVSPEQQAGMDLLQAIAECYPTPPPISTADPHNLPSAATGHSQQTKVSPRLPNLMLTATPNIGDQKLESGNTWKFAACVAALALTASTLIVCAVKGPSWYRLFHNYRHRRLRQAENPEGRAASSVYSETGRYVNRHTFTFQHRGAEGEDDSNYFEDPYIKAEE